MIKSFKTKIGKEDLIIEVGRMAKLADGAVTVQYGGSVVLTAVVAAKEVKEGADFFPLTVDYREKTYAAGKIPGGYFKREGRPSEKEILTSRLIDRPIRPLFPDGYANEVQVTSTVLSVDGENNPDVLAIIGASAALMVSSIPYLIPIGAVRVGLIDGNYVVNPTYDELEKSRIDLIVVGTEESVAMIEAGASAVSEEEMMAAIEFGHKQVQGILEAQKRLVAECGKPKDVFEAPETPEDILELVKKVCKGKFIELNAIGDKAEREEVRRELYAELCSVAEKELASDPEEYNEAQLKHAFEEFESDEIRDLIIIKKKRPDGRGFKDLRQITCEVAVLPRTHGSALFTRGQTQSLAVTTLGTSEDEQMIDALEGETFKRFMLHYNFPPFSVGEVKPNRGPGRREIGHGALAERALKSVMPSEEEFPYTVRIVSDILESNGSSSMASVCGSSLSLMDAGVPLKDAVAGIAIGLVTGEGRWELLTDIAGIEDHLGDMDFKVAGTRQGITALQLDVKIKGLSRDIIKAAFDQAREGRLKILDIMGRAMDKPRGDLSKYAPRITMLMINPDKIKDVIGPGGKVIKRITAETGALINIEDDGKVVVASTDSEAAEAAIRQIREITQEAEVGKIYSGKVRKIAAFGAFCEIFPGTDGLVHVSEIAEGYVKKVDDYLKVGDIIPVKVLNVDEAGKISLSIKAAKKELGEPDLPKIR